MPRRHLAYLVTGLVLTPLLTAGILTAARPLTTSATGEDGAASLEDLEARLPIRRQPVPTGQLREFTLVAQKAPWEIAPGVVVDAFTYNGTVPGPTIRVTEGDTVRVVLENRLDQDTTIHWHGLHVPFTMDGVPGLSQAPIKPGETFTYEFVASHAGTFMYHPHINSVEQIDNGLYGLLIIDPQTAGATRFDREFTMLLGAWNVATPTSAAGGAPMPDHSAMLATMRELIAAGPGDSRVQAMAAMMGVSPEQAIATWQGMLPMMEQMAQSAPMSQTMPAAAGDQAAGMGAMAGTSQPTPGHAAMSMSYNYFTINGRAYPAVEPWTVKQGDLVRVRLVNISNLAHPMHLHGHDFKVVAKDGEPLRPEQQYLANTLSVDAGETYDIVFLADNPGNWVFHCHELHHTENNGVEPGGLMQVIHYEGAPALEAPPTLVPAAAADSAARAPALAAPTLSEAEHLSHHGGPTLTPTPAPAATPAADGGADPHGH